MKIIQEAAPQWLGCRCDRCGREARQDVLSRSVTAAIRLGQFIEVDIRSPSATDRADLCPDCAGEILDLIRHELGSFRRVAEAGPTDARRSYRYQAVEASSGSLVRIVSIFDEGEL